MGRGPGKRRLTLKSPINTIFMCVVERKLVAYSLEEGRRRCPEDAFKEWLMWSPIRLKERACPTSRGRK